MSRDDSPDASRRCDVAIIGAGPAGLAAGLFTARYGLRTRIIDRGKGMLRQCAYLDNYLGFPGGIDVSEFLRLAKAHASDAGCDIVAEQAIALERADGAFVIRTTDAAIPAERVIVASGCGVEYLAALNDPLLVSADDEVRTIDGWGRTRISGLYAAGPVTGVENQALISAGHGAQVALGLIHDLRSVDVPWQTLARHLDWQVHKGRYDSERWAARVRDYFREQTEPNPADLPQFDAVLEHWIRTKRGQQISREEIRGRRLRARTLQNNDDTSGVESASGAPRGRMP